jgi:hypothetical protein
MFLDASPSQSNPNQPLNRRKFDVSQSRAAECVQKHWIGDCHRGTQEESRDEDNDLPALFMAVIYGEFVLTEGMTALIPES